MSNQEPKYAASKDAEASVRAPAAPCALSGMIVIGPGSIGLGIAVDRVWSGDTRVAVLGRRGWLAAGALETPDARLEAKFIEPTWPNGCVIVATKDHDVESVIAQHASLLRQAPIIAIQNGLGTAERLQHIAPVLGAVTWAFADRVTDGVARWARPIRLELDPNGPCAREALAFLGTQRVMASLAHDYRASRFSKLIVNASVNTLTALHGISCQQLSRLPDALSMAHAVAREMLALGRASGVHLELDPEQTVDEALRDMDEFMPSMVQDRLAGRALEVRAILEVPLRLALKLGVPMPVTTDLRMQLRQFERGSGREG